MYHFLVEVVKKKRGCRWSDEKVVEKVFLFIFWYLPDGGNK